MDLNMSAPPVNNLLQPDIYNRLDAELQERTRAVNSLLDKRLLVQERVLNRYRRSAEEIHNKESFKMRRELSRIRHSLPTVGLVHNLNAGLSERSSKRRATWNPLYLEKNDMPFCERHLVHFLPNKRKYYKRQKPVVTVLTQPNLATAVPGVPDIGNGLHPNLNSSDTINNNLLTIPSNDKPIPREINIIDTEMRVKVQTDYIYSKGHNKDDRRLQYHNVPCNINR